VTPQNIVLALLVFALIATRLWEESLWRAGRISDRTSAVLVVGRLPFLLFGFTLFTGQELYVVAAGTVLGILAAAALYPFVVRRLRRLASRPRSTPRPPAPPGPR
jgi:hypothetical protein